MKTCTKCKRELPLDCFLKSKQSKDGLSWRCRECHSQIRKEFYQRNPEKLALEKERRKKYYLDHLNEEFKKERSRKFKESYSKSPRRFRNADLMGKYGMTIEDYNAMYDRQGGKCAICGGRGNERAVCRKLSVDHCHLTGNVRGLLCTQCNVGMGSLKDSQFLLANALRYLKTTHHISDQIKKARGN